VEQKERRVGVGEGGVVGHRACAGDTRVQLSQPDVAGLPVDQEVELEIAAIAFLAELFAELDGEVARLLAELGREGGGKDLVAAPAAAIRGEFPESDKLGHQRPDDGAL